jgi:glucose-6-phosphate-specific signal transduction histidine kinase
MAEGARFAGGKVRARAPGTIYSGSMSSAMGHQQITQARPRGLALVFGWRRLVLALSLGIVFGAANSLSSTAPTIDVTIGHAVVVSLVAVLAFGLFEQRPVRLPPWLPRWVLQVGGVVIAVPAGALLAHSISMAVDIHSAHQTPQMKGLLALIVEGLLFGPWIALGAMLRQRDVFARDQALAFELERSEFERKALDARLRLLQAQVKPHFLFNTLANVQALVNAGSPQASKVLTNLIAYLRAAVPRMQVQTTTLDQEMELARAYLELMQMRMPDRLQFALHIEPAAAKFQCPPMTLLTLVENAVQHGIDPGEEGGRIDVDVWLRDGRCLLRVVDTGVGLKTQGGGLGTGLSTLRERMQLAFGGDARLTLTEIEPHGVCAELSFPARQ